MGKRMTNKEKKERLRAAFCRDANIIQACSIAGVSRAWYYRELEKDPHFAEQVEEWRQRTAMSAKEKVCDSIEKGDKDVIKWYLERRQKEEFGAKSEPEGASVIKVVFEEMK